MRHTTRGGWKPLKHERILKPDFQKDDDEQSPIERQDKNAASSDTRMQGFHGSDKEKLL
jgi:hypothetical protein